MQPSLAVARQFGKAVKELRLKKSLSQQNLADACGLDISYVGQIERGQRNPTLGVMQGIASVLHVRLSDVLKQARL
jgi:transcriptional regulator with XRE-family HTH domain